MTLSPSVLLPVTGRKKHRLPLREGPGEAAGGDRRMTSGRVEGEVQRPGVLESHCRVTGASLGQQYTVALVR